MCRPCSRYTPGVGPSLPLGRYDLQEPEQVPHAVYLAGGGEVGAEMHEPVSDVAHLVKYLDERDAVRSPFEAGPSIRPLEQSDNLAKREIVGLQRLVDQRRPDRGTS